MAELIVYGISISSYVRTVRLVCLEKGVSHRFVEMIPGGIVDGVSHPFGRVPIMKHGDFVLYESLAIARYLDGALPGPRLQPEGARDLARMDQWMSAASDYTYPAITRLIALPQRVSAQPFDLEQTGREELPDLRRQFAVYDAHLARHAFLAGADVTLADLFLAPMLHMLRAHPGGVEALSDYPAMMRWQRTLEARPSLRATEPEPLADAF
ncbi:glutathione S-transferase family protein [Zavarzinia sp. CC-PAN008]|uniref:glutathione S-transferase family protein n=1 Tax=Zavarzinia sp. CC-PAN008 TaxID=3243332 RepID=UPI003F74587A